jgi:predicted amidohydrolase YtcJ
MRVSSALLAAAFAATSFSPLCPAQTATAKPSSAGRTKTAPVKLGADPEIIFYNGVIYTGVGFAEGKPQTVQAMAVGGGKVLAIGTNEEIKRLAGPKNRLRDLRTDTTSVFVFPGFNDAHVHLGSAGQTKLNVDLTGVQSLAEMLAKIQALANAAPAGHWLTGGNWDHTLWPSKTLPTRQDLDKVTGGHPAFLDRIDGHISIANSAALAAAGITGKTVPPQGGAIDLDTNGKPTGILRETAQGLVYKVIPPPSHDERMRGDELAIADALAHGITSVQDFSEWEDFLVYEKLENQGKLHLRITEWLPFKAPLPDLIRMRNRHDMNDPMLHTGMLKGFMDGSLGSRTAAMKAPYADDPGNTGLPQYTQDQLNKMAVERAAFGFQLGFHAIGDKATAMALDAFTLAEQPQISLTPTMGPCRPAGQPYEIWDEKIPCSAASAATQPASALCKLKDGSPCYPFLAGLPPRNRIEHAQVVDPADIPRFKKLGIIASMQPNHLLTDMNWAEDRLGPKRAAYSYAWKTFLDAGVPLAFGTDYPVEPITPFRGLYAAVTRMNEAGTKTYFPENKLTRGQALYAYTQGSAYAEFAEKHKGKLIPGYDADFILVDRDLYKIPAHAILGTQVRETYVGGRESFAGDVFAPSRRRF